MLYACSKSDLARLDAVRRFTGIALEDAAGAELLSLTNRIWRSNTVPSRFISDSMVAVWLADDALAAMMPDLLSEADQYKLLAWYCCARPRDTGCLMSREPVDPILYRMAREAVVPSPVARLPYSALMMAVYHFRADLQDAVSLHGESRLRSFLGWYYSHGIRELAIIHHVSPEERAALNQSEGEGEDGLAPLCLLATEWLPHPELDLSLREGREAARSWFAEALGTVEPFATLADASLVAQQSAETPEPNVIAADFGDRTRPGDSGSAYRVEPRHAEYFDRRGGGTRLLLPREWFPAEATLSWSRTPWASLAFELAEPIGDSVTLGILLDPSEEAPVRSERQLTVYLNGQAFWSGTDAQATGGELVLRVGRGALRTGTANLLQFHVSEPVVPAELGYSADTRPLGVALRRFWVDDDRQGAARAFLRPLPRPVTAGTRQVRRKLLVIRGDLRSHTGYGKASRALAALIPDKFNVIGVDIHPDPTDNQAVVPFPVVPEPEALQQVAEHPGICAVLHCTSPDEFAVWPNARNIGWFFWETEAVPYLRQWPFKLSLMDAVWAPTTFMQEFIRSAGYDGPVHPVAWPDEFAAAADPADSVGDIGAQYFTVAGYRPRPLRVADLRAEARLLLLGVQSLAARKGLPLLLREWRQHIVHSGGADALVLRLAFRHASGLSADWQEVFDDALSAAGFRRGAPVRIAVIPDALSEGALAALYRIADAYVSMSYGEGFGGPVVEAMRNGCPVIAPRHTGLRDLIPQEYPLAIATTRLAVGLKGNLPSYPHSATWHVPNPGELQQKMPVFAAMTPGQREQMLQNCRKHAMSFCWTPIVRQRLAAALDDLDLDGPGRAVVPVRAVTPSPAGRHAAD